MMKTALKIIRSFIEDKKPKTIRELARQIRADYRITHIAVQRLIAQTILTVQTIGKSSLCALNPTYYGVEIYEAEHERKQDILKKIDINQLYKEIMSKLPSTFCVMLIFGSYAKCTATKTSDTDLFIIPNEKDF